MIHSAAVAVVVRSVIFLTSESQCSALSSDCRLASVSTGTPILVVATVSVLTEVTVVTERSGALL
jgi:hypothetical protein